MTGRGILGVIGPTRNPGQERKGNEDDRIWLEAVYNVVANI